MCLACGLFIYVTINHLLEKGYAPDKAVLWANPTTSFSQSLVGIWGNNAVVMIWDICSHMPEIVPAVFVCGRPHLKPVWNVANYNSSDKHEFHFFFFLSLNFFYNTLLIQVYSTVNDLQ